MKTFSNTFPITELSDFSQNFITEQMLFFDIETTGLSPSQAQIYCIGCGFRTENQIQITLFFAETPEDEPQLLKAFCDKTEKFEKVITFNGSTFDLPFVSKKLDLFSSLIPAGHIYTSDYITSKESIDLFRKIKKMKGLLELPSYSQKSIEKFLGIFREDEFNGGQLIHIYKQYLTDPRKDFLELLFLHNYEDIRGMFHLTDLLSYEQLTLQKYQIVHVIPENDGETTWCNFKIKPEYPFPQSIHKKFHHSFLAVNQEYVLIRFPVFHGELKHFFQDIENYYYLPEEDTAIHKSIGEFVDRTHRKRATKRNCYIKKECDYITIPVRTNSYLKKDFPDKNSYLEISSQKDATDFLNAYFSLVLE